jgi:hypothetical protein
MNTQVSSRTELFGKQNAPMAAQPKPTKKLSLKRETIRVANAGSHPIFGGTIRCGGSR